LITLSNGISFSVIAASGSLGFDGRGYPWDKAMESCGLIDLSKFKVRVAKTVTLNRLPGNWKWYNPFWSFRFIKDGTVNAIALKNEGFNWFNSQILNNLSPEFALIVSLSGTCEELRQMGRRLSGNTAIGGVVLNLSCPNIKVPLDEHGIRTRLISLRDSMGNIPLLVKLSVLHRPLIQKLIPCLMDCKVEAIKINSVPWRLAFPDRISPLRHLRGGGVSGKAAQKVTRPFIKELVELSSIPVIAPNIWTYEDIEQSFALGAKAVSLGSILTPPHIFRAAKILKKL